MSNRSEFIPIPVEPALVGRMSYHDMLEPDPGHTTGEKRPSACTNPNHLTYDTHVSISSVGQCMSY